MTIQHATAHPNFNTHDFNIMSRARPFAGAPDRRRSSVTMSYPQRIAAMLADAPEPPALHRAPPAAQSPLGEQTQAMLISVHTLNATFG